MLADHHTLHERCSWLPKSTLTYLFFGRTRLVLYILAKTARTNLQSLWAVELPFCFWILPDRHERVWGKTPQITVCICPPLPRGLSRVFVDILLQRTLVRAAYSWLDKLTSYFTSVVQYFHRRLWAPLVVYWRKYIGSCYVCRSSLHDGTPGGGKLYDGRLRRTTTAFGFDVVAFTFSCCCGNFYECTSIWFWICTFVNKPRCDSLSCSLKIIKINGLMGKTNILT